MMFLYLGPEVIGPLASLLAAVGGVLLMFWRRVVDWTRAMFQLITGKGVDSRDSQIEENLP